MALLRLVEVIWTQEWVSRFLCLLIYFLGEYWLSALILSVCFLPEAWMEHKPRCQGPGFPHPVTNGRFGYSLGSVVYVMPQRRW